MNDIQQQVLAEVKAERDYQDTLWNTAARDDVTSETNDLFRGYINEYNNNEFIRGKARTERERFLKVAALAVAAIERIDRVNAAGN